MLSTQCSAGMTSVTVRRNQERTEKPIVVNNYNLSMNGIYRADQNSVYYPFIRKWCRKLFFWLFEVSVVNSYILYSIHTNNQHIRPLTHLQYRRRVVEPLASHCIQAAPPRARPGRPRKRHLTTSCPNPERLHGRLHILKKRDQAQHCVVCSNREKGERHRN